MQTRLLVGMLLAVALGAPLARSGEVRCGWSKLRLQENSPLFVDDVTWERWGAAGFNFGAKDIEIDLYVPSDYDPSLRYGLAVFEWQRNPPPFVGSAPNPPWRGYEAVFERRGLIAAMGGVLPGFSLNIAHNIKELYSIDGKRIYMIGGEMVGKLSIAFADVFSGGFAVNDFSFYKLLFPLPPSPPGPKKGVVVVDPSDSASMDGYRCPIQAPPHRILVMAKVGGRHVLMGSSEDRAAIMRTICQRGFKAEGFAHATYLDGEDFEGRYPGASDLERGICVLDAPLAPLAKKQYEAARKLEASGRISEAVRAYRMAAYGGGASAAATEAWERITALREELPARLREAKAAYEENRLTEASRLLTELVQHFGEKATPEAAKLLARLRADPVFQRKVAEEKTKRACELAEAAAQGALSAAREFLRRDAVEAYEALRRVAKEHAGTDAARDAATEAALLLEDPELRARIEGAKDARAAERLLRQARNYAANGMNALARKKLQEIVTKFRDTRAAGQAEKLLETLGP